MSNKQAASPSPIQRIAVLYHPKIAATQPVAQDIDAWLKEQGRDSFLGLTWDAESIRPRLDDIDLIVVLGGDGSMLRAARMSAPLGKLVVGVNMGRLGFLSEMTPRNWRKRLARVLAGDYWIEKRLMLVAEAWRDDHLLSKHLALNDVVISRGSLARVIRLRTEVDGDLLTTYSADGLIVSTPTGSTAYAMAVGGPILPPELHNILVIPIAAHMSLDRAVVLSEGCLVRIHVGTDHQAILTVDGQFEFEMQDGDYLEVHTGKHLSRFVRLGPRTYFYRSLMARLEPKQVDPYIKQDKKQSSS